MTHCFPPLSALTRSEYHRGDLVTTDTAEPDDAIDNRAEAERLLDMAAASAEKLAVDPADSGLVVQVLQVLATAGTGLAQLAAIDSAHELANRQASLFGEVLAEFRRSTTATHPTPAGDEPADFLLDKTDDRWTHTGNGLYESTQDSGLYDMPIETIREQWGPVREYVLRPPRPAD